MFMKKKKKEHSSLEYYLCAGIIFSQVILILWDLMESKKKENR